jgi:hypothetical protein
MTRKDYILIAEALRVAFIDCRDTHIVAIREARPEDAQGWYCRKIEVERIADSIAALMANDNARFDREHFLAVVRGERELQSRPPRKAA